MRGRIRIAELYGSKRGAVTDAINEAVKLWLKETKRPPKKWKKERLQPPSILESDYFSPLTL